MKIGDVHPTDDSLTWGSWLDYDEETGAEYEVLGWHERCPWTYAETDPRHPGDFISYSRDDFATAGIL